MITNNTNMYDIMSTWISEIGPKYFDNMNALGLSRVGSFGYINEIMANSVEDNFRENTLLFNETFMNKAILPESILSYAALYLQDITEINAIPCVMMFSLGIREDMLKENLIKDRNGNFYFILDKNTRILVEDEFEYLMDYDIRINARIIKNEFVYSAQFVMDEKNPISDIVCPFIKLSKVDNYGTSYIFLLVPARQLIKKVSYKNIYDEDFIDNFSNDIPIVGDQLANFNVYYRPPEKDNFILLDKRIIDSSPPLESKYFLYYQFRDEKTLNISFSTINRHFKPKPNSELKIEIYTTKGEDAKFKYTGDNVRVIPTSEVYDYNNLIIIGKAMSDSDGGINKKSFDEIRKLCIYYASTCCNIGTADDLNKFFQNIRSDSRFLFVKKRDDILDRLFTAYTLLRDEKKNVVPTNTLPLFLENDEDFDTIDDVTKRYVVKAGKRFIYDGVKNQMRRLNEDYALNKNEFLYSNPFSIVVSKNPYIVTYYLNSINKEFQTQLYYSNKYSLMQFINNFISIKRDAINDENEYVMRFTLTPSVLNDKIKHFAELDDEDKFVKSNDRVIVKGVIMNYPEKYSYYFDTTMIDYDASNKNMTFEARLKTDDYVSLENGLRILDTLYKIKSNKSDKTVRKDCIIDGSAMEVELLVFYKDDYIDDNEDTRLLKNITNLKNYNLTNIYKPFEKIDLINNMSDIMRSTLLLKPIDDTVNAKYNYLIKEVPMIKYEYIKDKMHSLHFSQIMYKNALLLRQRTNSLSNNFSLDMKLYNTYGRSHYFFIRNNPKNILDKINIELKFKIKLNPNKKFDNDLRDDISQFIIDYVEKSNEETNFYVSNLIRKLENEFIDILFIEFDNLNDYGNDVQYIEKDFPLNDFNKLHLIKDFVPEFININKNYEDGEIKYDMIIDFI